MNISPEDYLDLVDKLARHIKKRCPKADYEDLLQEGCVGLMKGIKDYRSYQKCSPKTYLSIRARGEMLESLRRSDTVSKVNRKKAREIEAARLRVEAREKRAATHREVSREWGGEGYEEVMLSLMGGGNVSDSYNDEFFSINPEHGGRVDFSYLEIALSGLREGEFKVVDMLYREELSMKEIGRRMGGLSESRISQIHKDVIGKLRGEMGVAA